MEHLSHLGIGIKKHPPSLRERAILTLTGLVAGAPIDSEGQAPSQLSLSHPIMKMVLSMLPKLNLEGI